MATESVLVWNGKSDAFYREARRQITIRRQTIIKTIKEIDFADFFKKNTDSLVYFPVFQGMAGWWGPLLGSNAKIRSKIIVSPECQLYEIGCGHTETAHRLFAAEIPPKAAFFSKLRECSATIKDMIATNNGTILALLGSASEDRVRRMLKTGGGEYFGPIGGY
jgi:hypothetical protein